MNMEIGLNWFKIGVDVLKCIDVDSVGNEHIYLYTPLSGAHV